MIKKLSNSFYHFLGFHSFLIGVFPFFVPVFLWNMGFTIAHVSLFIALTGLGFFFTLFAWEHIRICYGFKTLIFLSFLFEIVLVSSMFFIEHSIAFGFIAILNGIYNCFFWITQRSIFFEKISSEDAGEKFGNFQIFTFAFLKMGTLIGSFFLENYGLFAIWIFSLLCIIGAAVSAWYMQKNMSYPKRETEEKATTLKEILSFSDSHNSQAIFILDGPFLFLESYFWTISLFLITNENFLKLGLLIIGLSIAFAGIFYLLKNTIDHLPVKTVYYVSTILYALSWILRGHIEDISNTELLFSTIFVIAFFSSLFRLSFNKEFFVTAKHTKQHTYLMVKSYYSQASIAIVFFIIALLFAKEHSFDMNALYTVSAIFALGYLGYMPHSLSSSIHKEKNNT